VSHDAIEKIYQTIEDPDVWPEALQSVADATDSAGALIMLLLPNRARIAIPSPALAAAASDYIENWAAKDIRSNRLEERKLLLTNDTIADEDVVTPAEMETDPFYAVFLKKHGLRYFCASSWMPTQQSFLALSLQRSEAQGAYGPADRQSVLMYGRHIERAMRLRGRLVQEETRRETLESVVGAQHLAVILTDIDGRVAFANDAARRLPKDIFSIAGDRLRFGSMAQSAPILDLMRQAEAGEIHAANRTLFLSSNDGGPGYALNVMRRPRPFSDKVQIPIATEAPILLVLTPVRLEHEFDAAITRDFLRLSLGEARVAALIASGKSPGEAAEILGLTRETVRFTLKQVYLKTGFRRQSQLAAALNALRKLPADAAPQL
jgi:DNA-binding CsgD family transcriptional regulator/PAS domain-containing protein